MLTVEDIRHAKIMKLFEEHGGDITAFSRKLGKSYAQVWQWINRARNSRGGSPRSISSESARYIEKKLGLELGWMDFADTIDRDIIIVDKPEEKPIKPQEEIMKTPQNFNDLVAHINDLNAELERSKRRLADLLLSDSSLSFSQDDGLKKNGSR